MSDISPCPVAQPLFVMPEAEGHPVSILLSGYTPRTPSNHVRRSLFPGDQWSRLASGRRETPRDGVRGQNTAYSVDRIPALFRQPLDSAHTPTFSIHPLPPYTTLSAVEREPAMAWRAKAGREQKVLASIVSRLFSFADLVEDAALRSPWARWCILWAGWQANALLRDYVEGRAGNMTASHWSPVPMPSGFGSHADDARNLAASLRALALMVRAIAAQVSRVAFLQQGDGSDEAGNDGRRTCSVPGYFPAAAASPVEFRDTS